MVSLLLFIFVFIQNIENKSQGIHLADSKIRRVQIEFTYDQCLMNLTQIDNAIGFDKNILLFNESAAVQSFLTPSNSFTNLNLYMSLIDQSQMNISFPQRHYLKEYNENRTIFFQFNQIQLMLEHLYSLVFVQMKKSMNISFYQKLESSVVVIPGNWEYATKSTLSNIGFISNIEIMEILTPPIASAIKYSLNKHNSKNQVIVFISAGSQLLQGSVIKFQTNQNKNTSNQILNIKLLSKLSVINLGVLNIDQIIVSLLLNRLHDGRFNFIERTKYHLKKLWKKLPEIKQDLSLTGQAYVQIKGISNTSTKYSAMLELKNLHQKLLFIDMTSFLNDLLAKSGIIKQDVSEIYLTQMTSNLYLNIDHLKQYFQGKNVKISDNKYEIAEGAALFAANITKEIDLSYIHLYDQTQFHNIIASIKCSKSNSYYDDEDEYEQQINKTIETEQNNNSFQYNQTIFSRNNYEFHQKIVTVFGQKRCYQILIQLFDNQKNIRQLKIYKSYRSGFQSNRTLFIKFVTTPTLFNMKIQPYYQYTFDSLPDWIKTDLNKFMMRKYSQFNYQIDKENPNIIRQHISIYDHGRFHQFGSYQVGPYHRALLKRLYKNSYEWKIKIDIQYFEDKIQMLMLDEEQHSDLKELLIDIENIRFTMQNSGYRKTDQQYEEMYFGLNQKIKRILIDSKWNFG